MKLLKTKNEVAKENETPILIIINSAYEVEIFSIFIKELFKHCKIEEDYKSFMIVILTSIIDYICDNETAEAALRELSEELSNIYSPVIMAGNRKDFVYDAIYRIGNFLITDFRALGLFDKDGALWYKFNTLFKHDIVLEQLSKEDLIN